MAVHVIEGAKRQAPLLLAVQIEGLQAEVSEEDIHAPAVGNRARGRGGVGQRLRYGRRLRHFKETCD